MDFDNAFHLFRDTLNQFGISPYQLYFVGILMVLLFTLSLREVFRYFSGVAHLSARISKLEQTLLELQPQKIGVDKKSLELPKPTQSEYAVCEFLIRN